MITRAIRFGAVLSMAVLAASCDDGVSPDEDAASLQVRPAVRRSVEGAAVELDARFFTAGGRLVERDDVVWSSLDPDIVDFSAQGATALGPGWARVVATAEGDESLTDTALVAVGVRFSGVTAGDGYSCGWTEDGAGWCWGSAHVGSFYPGVLGAGTGEGSATPVRVANSSSFTQLDAGATHACGVADGSVYCWGYDRGGALGFNGCGANSCDEPIDMEIAGTFTDVSVPAWFDRTTCATGPAGLHCWGATAFGALGVFPLPCSPTCPPQLVSTALTGDVSMGRQHGCALDAAGQAYCWGDNQLGQLGIGEGEGSHSCGFGGTPCTPTPTPVATALRFEQLESGTYFTCGRTAEGRVFCWGNYDAFDLGANTEPGATPVEVSGDLRFTTIGAGWFHACGTSTAGELYCWGQATWDYAMGLPVGGDYVVIDEPRLIDSDGTRFTAVDVGPQQTCAVAVDGSMRCMGSDWGLGQGSFLVTRAEPIPVLPPGPVPDGIDLAF